ncbi:MAG: type II toxin-antitoxin system RatA family toxin [Gammaproteobacteria bacterium]|jgi:coenzyme Q-binding protein COQ10|nr:type II toxin-antitoxin system RatA family toxin [Gammaproteobacteria bacterium]
MHTYTEKRVLPCTREQAFDLVADVESYHEFVPTWLAARITERQGNELIVDQVVGLGAFPLEFISHTSLKPPDRIHVVARDDPFRYLDINWDFEPASQSGCLTRLRVEFELSSSLLQSLLTRLFRISLRQVLSAFDKRASQLYRQPDRE